MSKRKLTIEHFFKSKQTSPANLSVVNESVANQSRSSNDSLPLSSSAPTSSCSSLPSTLPPPGCSGPPLPGPASSCSVLPLPGPSSSCSGLPLPGPSTSRSGLPLPGPSSNCSGLPLPLPSSIYSGPPPPPGPSSSYPGSLQVQCKYNNLDIGLHVGKPLTQELKLSLLKNVWTPPELYKFPRGERNLKFQRQWLAEFPWLCYSENKKGAYCKYCSIFSAENTEVGKGSHVRLGYLVKEPYNGWKKAKEYFRSHEASDYHKQFLIKAQNFLSVFEKKRPDVATQIDIGRRTQILENRKKLMPIIKTVILCGRQELPLRGHRDHGPLTLEEQSENDGNFRALLRYRIDGGDDTLKDHVTSCALNASYLSYNIQNEIIETCGNIILSQIVERVNEAECFSILADETSDIAGVEQFTLGVRYTCKNSDEKYTLREDFLKFVPVIDTRGVALANTLIETIKDMGIDLKHLCGQGYDGATAMSGQFQGCAAIVRERFPQAIYVHCARHSFNLALCHACSIPVIRNCLGTMKEVINFFRISPKRSAVFTHFLQESNPSGTKKTRLTKFCETRWVEHLDAIMLFKDTFLIICNSLREIHENPEMDSETSSKAYTLLSAIEKCSFVAAMVSVSKIFSLSHNLSTSLQSETIDLVYFLNHADNLKKEVFTMRNNSEAQFQTMFKEVVSLCEAAEINIDVPRQTSRQKNRDNYLSDDPQTYYRRSVFIPFLDYFLHQIDLRFLNHRKLIESLQLLLPHHCCSLSEDQIREISETLSEFWLLDSDSFSGSVEAELLLWRRKWLECKDKTKPKYFITCLNECDKNIFPALHKVLKIGATIPVTTATCERSFSTLRRVKSYLRSTTGQDRLNGLALLSIHRDVSVQPEEVLNKMAQNKSRRLEFLL